MIETIIISILCLLLGVLLCLVLFKKKEISNTTNKKSLDKKNVKAPIEFSKKILMASYAIAIVVILYTMYIIHLMIIGQYMGDPSSLNTLIMLTLGELGAANSFYFWKSRLENKIKLEAEYGHKILDSEGDDII